MKNGVKFSLGIGSTIVCLALIKAFVDGVEASNKAKVEMARIKSGNTSTTNADNVKVEIVEDR